jgi:outer membrane lipoprotein-sorting protein
VSARHGWLAAIVIACLAWPCHAANLALADLMAMLARVPSATDSFTETRQSAFLSAPLVLKGTLAYARPGRLEKHVQSPYDERTVIDGDNVTLENRTTGQARAFSLSSSAAATALVESLRATLAGDSAALERHYRIQVEGTKDAWTLVLLPRDAKVAGYVTRIRIAGAAGKLSRVEVEEASGDSSTMTIGSGRS